MEFKNFKGALNNQSINSNKDWWENNPMTYDWEDENQVAKSLTKEWFKKIDEKFFSISEEFAHPNSNSEPFSELINLQELKGKKVLEIGCGMGSHSGLLAKYAKELTSIDITKTAINTTNKRFELFGLNNAKAINVDAENMPFENDSFDFIWSWGVIHHSNDTNKIAKEIHRVLKIGGKSTVMIYNKNSTRYYIHGLYQGIFRLKFLRYNSLYKVNMTFTDGFIARHYTRKSARNLFKAFTDIKFLVRDAGPASVIIGWGRLLKIFPKIFKPINQWINFRWGWFLIINLKK